VHRLGASNVLHPQHYSLHWSLDTKCDSNYELMLFFVREALKDESMPNWYNMRLTGRTRAIPENANMLGLLTTDTPTPIVSMDILMADSFKLLAGRSDEEVAAMQPGDKLDVRMKLSQLLETRCGVGRRVGVLPQWVSHPPRSHPPDSLNPPGACARARRTTRAP